MKKINYRNSFNSFPKYAVITVLLLLIVASLTCCSILVGAEQANDSAFAASNVGGTASSSFNFGDYSYNSTAKTFSYSVGTTSANMISWAGYSEDGQNYVLRHSGAPNAGDNDTSGSTNGAKVGV